MQLISIFVIRETQSVIQTQIYITTKLLLHVDLAKMRSCRNSMERLYVDAAIMRSCRKICCHVSYYMYSCREHWRGSVQTSVNHAKVAYCDTVEYVIFVFLFRFCITRVKYTAVDRRPRLPPTELCRRHNVSNIGEGWGSERIHLTALTRYK